MTLFRRFQSLREASITSQIYIMLRVYEMKPIVWIGKKIWKSNFYWEKEM